MTVYSIVFSYLLEKWPTSLLNIIVMALGVALMTSLLLFSHQIKERLFRDSAGIDVVVGAKGSPLQLILSSVQHIDIPTGNITLADAKRISRHGHVKRAIPLALGDSYRGYRIVGTDASYLTHFEAEYATGGMWQGAMQAVIGAKVAAETGLVPGSTFVGAHGLMPGGHGHDDKPYQVVGVLAPNASVLDRLILTSLESVWNIHHQEPAGHQQKNAKHKHASHHQEKHHGGHHHSNHHHDDHDHEHHHDHHAHEQHANDHHDHSAHHDDDVAKADVAASEITALLVSYRNRAAALSFPRFVNQQTNMLAASPSFEMARLFELIGVGSDTLMIFSAFLVGVVLVSVLIGLFNNVRERRYDLAVFRSLGASRSKIMMMVLIEGISVALIGGLLGLLLGHGAIELLGTLTARGTQMGLGGFVWLADVWLVWGLVLLSSAMICLVPAWQAYKTDIRHKLIQG